MHHSSMSWEIILLYFCGWNYMIFTKEVHHSAKFQTFDCSGEISPNLYFDRLLLLKVYKVSAKKKYGGNMSLDTKEWCKIWIKTYFCFKNDKNLVNFDPSTKKSKKFALWLVPSVQSIQRLTYKNTKEYISWHWRFMQNLKKSWLVVWKMTWGIWQIFIKTLESVKIGIFMGFFCPK